MADIKVIYENHFAKAVVEDGSAIALSSHKKQKAGEEIISTPYSEYVHQVLSSFTELQKICENLDMAEIFLKSYNVSKSWKNEYDQNHYITYHYEMWIINAIRLYERLLILVNSVYWLEISHKETTFTTITAHKKMSGTDTLKVLNKVHGALSDLQGLKNSVFHRYLYDDDELSEITTYNFLARNSEGEDKLEFAKFAKLKTRYIYLPRKRKELQANNKQLLLAAVAVLKTLDKHYLEHRNSLQS